MLLDSNIIIYAAQPVHAFLRQFIAQNEVVVSAVSYVETCGYHLLKENERRFFEQFFNAAHMLPISHDVILKATELRQRQKMSLGDALIAATAICYQHALVTRNIQDFSKISELKLIDPFQNHP